jgi:transcriptional regulator with XRE-family HTH domain
MTFGKKIRGLRLKYRLTREQVSSLLAWPLSTYVDFEEDKVEPCDEAVTDFSNLYGVDKKFLKPPVQTYSRISQIKSR